MKPSSLWLAGLISLASASIIPMVAHQPPLDDLPYPPPYSSPPSKLGGSIFTPVSSQVHRRTIYDIVRANPNTQRFAALLDSTPDLRARLSNPDALHTLFVPADDAWDGIPDKAVTADVLRYHVLEGAVDVGRVLRKRTLATVLDADHLGGREQRLRVSVSIFGAHLNMYSKIMATDFHASNGIIHGLSAVVFPPPEQTKLLSLFPDSFSTLSRALSQSGLRRDLRALSRTGGTLFAPTDFAWSKLGREANEFLFSQRGEKYLHALLRYHVVVNETMYSDRHYKGNGDDDDVLETLPAQPEPLAELPKRGVDENDPVTWLRLSELNARPTGDSQAETETKHHIRLPTLLPDRSLFVEVSTWRSLTNVLVNGRALVTVKDGVASDGVVQTVGSVLVPPRSQDGVGGFFDDEWVDEISEAMLKERLGPYVEEGEEVWTDL